MMWRISLFGNLSVGPLGQEVRVPNRRVGALLGMLALVPRRTWTRDELVYLFWPDSDQASGRRNLRQAVFVLRQFLSATFPDAPELILGDDHSVWVNSDLLRTDLQEFETALESSEPAQWREADQVYRGPLLKDLSNPIVDAERIRLEAAYLSLLRQLINHERSLGNWDGAIGYAQRAVAQDQLNEKCQFTLIRLYARTDQFPAAKRQYAALERLLADELQSSPSQPLSKLLSVQREQAHVEVAKEKHDPPIQPSRRQNLQSWVWGLAAALGVMLFVSLAIARTQFREPDFPTLRTQFNDLSTKGNDSNAMAQQVRVVQQFGEMAWADAYEAREDFWQGELEPMLDRITQAQTWAAEHDPAAAVQIGGALMRYYLLAGQQQQWADLLQKAIDKATPVETTTMARAYVAVGCGRQERTDDQMQRQLERALAIYRSLGDRWGEAHALRTIGFVEAGSGRPTEAISHYQAALRINKDISCTSGMALCHLCMSLAHSGSDPLTNAMRREIAGWAKESLKGFLKLGNRWGVPFAAGVMSERAMALKPVDAGLMRECRDLLKEAAEFEGRHHNTLSTGAFLQTAARLSLKVGDKFEAGRILMKLASETYFSQMSWENRYIVMIAVRRLDHKAYERHGGDYMSGIALKRVSETRGTAFADALSERAVRLPLEDAMRLGLAGFLE